jgi:hypothetical protein
LLNFPVTRPVSVQCLDQAALNRTVEFRVLTNPPPATAAMIDSIGRGDEGNGFSDGAIDDIDVGSDCLLTRGPFLGDLADLDASGFSLAGGRGDSLRPELAAREL